MLLGQESLYITTTYLYMSMFGGLDIDVYVFVCMRHKRPVSSYSEHRSVTGAPGISTSAIEAQS